MHPISASSGDDISIYRRSVALQKGMEKDAPYARVLFVRAFSPDLFSGFARSSRRRSSVKFTDNA